MSPQGLPFTLSNRAITRERLVTALIFALLAHGVILLGVGFVSLVPKASSNPMVQVTLVRDTHVMPPPRRSVCGRGYRLAVSFCAAWVSRMAFTALGSRLLLFSHSRIAAPDASLPESTSTTAPSPVSASAPTIILTLAVADSIHILVSWLQLRRGSAGKLEALVEAIELPLPEKVVSEDVEHEIMHMKGGHDGETVEALRRRLKGWTRP